MAEAASQSNSRKLDEILKLLDNSEGGSLHNIEVLTERILGEVGDIKARVVKLEKDVIIGNGEPPLKEQVHLMRRDLEDNTDKLECHIKDDVKRQEKTGARWEKIFFQVLQVATSILTAYLLIRIGLK